jgi:hypothetical protein
VGTGVKPGGKTPGTGENTPCIFGEIVKKLRKSEEMRKWGMEKLGSGE